MGWYIDQVHTQVVPDGRQAPECQTTKFGKANYWRIASIVEANWKGYKRPIEFDSVMYERNFIVT